MHSIKLVNKKGVVMSFESLVKWGLWLLAGAVLVAFVVLILSGKAGQFIEAFFTKLKSLFQFL